MSRVAAPVAGRLPGPQTAGRDSGEDTRRGDGWAAHGGGRDLSSWGRSQRPPPGSTGIRATVPRPCLLGGTGLTYTLNTSPRYGKDFQFPHERLPWAWLSAHLFLGAVVSPLMAARTAPQRCYPEPPAAGPAPAEQKEAPKSRETTRDWRGWWSPSLAQAGFQVGRKTTDAQGQPGNRGLNQVLKVKATSEATWMSGGAEKAAPAITQSNYEERLTKPRPGTSHRIPGQHSPGHRGPEEQERSPARGDREASPAKATWGVVGCGGVRCVRNRRTPNKVWHFINNNNSGPMPVS